MQAIFFELPPAPLCSVELERAVTDICRSFSYLSREDFRLAVSQRGRPGIMLRLVTPELMEVCDIMRQKLDKACIEYVEHMYLEDPQLMRMRIKPVSLPQKCRKMLRGARAFVRMEMWAAAYRRYADVCEEIPQCGEALYGMALCCHMEGDQEKARVYLEKMRSLGCATVRGCHLLADIYADAGDIGKAIEAIDEALALDPAEPRSYDALGWLLWDNGSAEQAELAFSEALSLESEYVSSMLGIGCALLEQGRSDEALPYLERLAECQPNHDFARLMYAECLRRCGRAGEACEEFMRLSSENSGTLSALADSVLGFMFLSEGKIDTSLIFLRKCYQGKGTSPQSSLLLCEALARSGLGLEAGRIFSERFASQKIDGDILSWLLSCLGTGKGLRAAGSGKLFPSGLKASEADDGRKRFAAASKAAKPKPEMRFNPGKVETRRELRKSLRGAEKKTRRFIMRYLRSRVIAPGKNKYLHSWLFRRNCFREGVS
ncbi:MAG: tetratricopeptide repeat protein [bacterium]|nr:tetratricopeptide repeat protein [bacterium]